MIVLFGLVWTLMSIGYPAALAVQDQPKIRVIIQPFTVHAEKDLTFLSRGVQNILSSIIARADGVEIVDIDEMDFSDLKSAGSENARPNTIAAEYGADYYLKGTLTVFGGRISTDAELKDIRTNRSILNFHRLGEKNGDALVHAELLGKQAADALNKQKPGSAPVKSGLDGTEGGASIDPETVDTKPDDPSRAPLTPFFKSGPIQGALTSIAIGDLDGNGRNEIVCASTNTIRIYRYKDASLTLMGDKDVRTHETIIGTDIADIDGDGRAELFITRHDNRGYLKSFAAVWNGNELETISDDLNLYLRNVHIGERGYVLSGQKRGLPGIDSEFTANPADALFQGDIFEIIHNNNGYEAGEPVRTPRDHILYGFGIGDVSDVLQNAMVSFTDQEKLCIAASNGKTVWFSKDYYGGGSLYLRTRDSGLGTGGGRFYLYPRIHLYDSDGNGRDEIYVQRNKDLGGRMLSRIRKYSEGWIERLEWNGRGLTPKGRIGPFSGYIGDSMIGDINGDGMMDLIFSTISSNGVLLKRNVSSIIAAAIDQEKP